MRLPLEIRQARPDEHAAVGELTAWVYEAEGWGTGGYLDVLRDVAGRAADADVLVAVAPPADGQTEELVVGAVTVATHGGRFAELAGPGEAVIRMLVTDPAVRGAGVGTALVQACLDAARRDGCTRILLSTQAEMAAAHTVYERLGFRRTPESDWQPEPGLTLLTYALDLPP